MSSHKNIHPKMDRENRAKQFMPFDALKGFREALEEKDHYKIFMGGNYAKVIIETGANTGRSLLLVKDSFANSFVPFLTEDYDTITLIDLRHCREEVQTIADGCTDVLVLYELTNFASDNNLFKLN